MTEAIPCSFRWSSGPTPESIRIWGDPMAPALRMISSASTAKASSSETASTPVALGRSPLVSKRILFTCTLALMVRFSRWRDSPRYPMAVDHRMPLGLFRGMGPTPAVPGALWSSQCGCPLSRKASNQTLFPGRHSSWGNRWQMMGPLEP